MRKITTALFVVSLLLAGVANAQPAPAAGKTAPQKPGAARPGDKGLIPPKILKEVRPQYTADAMKAKIQGRVILECVVETDGTVSDVTVLKSLDKEHGLDEEAVKAARQWRFKPGTKKGKPVPVAVTIELSFTLRDGPPKK